MTGEEAIYRISEHMERHGIGEYPHIKLAEALNMAIDALRKLTEVAKDEPLKTTWETPEICPHCMEHLSRDWSFCPECGRVTEWSKIEPLTMDELLKMNGEPVWIQKKDGSAGWGILWCNSKSGVSISGSKVYIGFLDFGDYGKTWLAYRCKPEGG